MRSQPDAHSRMNGLRRCAYWSISNTQMIAAPKAAARNGLIEMSGGLALTISDQARRRHAMSNVKLLRFVRPLHDEAEPRRRVLAHQLVDHAVGHDLIGHVHALQPSRPRVQRRFPQNFRHHLAEALEACDL